MMKKSLFLGLLLTTIFACNSKTDSQDVESLTLSAEEKALILQDAQKIAMTSQQELGGQLMQQLQESGSLGALDFCSVHAINITDDLSKTHKTNIKRRSDQPRNPHNVANLSQLDYMEMVKEKLKNQEEVEAFLEVSDSHAQAYFPIVTHSMCLQCHGIPGEDISDETFAKINELYPEDKATHYGENELRGIWVIDVLLK